MSKLTNFLLNDMQRVLDYYQERNKDLSKEIELLKKRQKTYEKALHFYGNPDSYGDRGEYWHIVIDGGKTARRALEDGDNGQKEEPVITKEVDGRL